MKKILLITTMIIMLFPSISVFAETQTPESPPTKRQSVHTKRNVACPPSYVGQSKTCVLVPNPDFENRKVTTPRKPLPNGNPTAVYWAMYGAMEVVSKTQAGKQAVDTFWNDVDKVDQTAGQIMNKLIDGNVDTTLYEDAWQIGTSSADRTVNISSDLYNKLFNAVQDVLGSMTGFEGVKENWQIEFLDWTKFATLTVSQWSPTNYALKAEATKEYFFKGTNKKTGAVNHTKTLYSERYNNGEVTGDGIPLDKRRVEITGEIVTTSLQGYLAWLNAVSDSTFMVVLSDNRGDATLEQKNVTYPSGVTSHGTVIEIGLPPTIDTDTKELPEESEIEGEPHREAEVKPEKAPTYIPPDITKVPGLIPTKKGTGGVFIPEVIVVEKETGKPVLPDGSVGDKPVVDPSETVIPKPTPVQPPALPPKDTTAPTGEDLPTKDAEEEGNRWKALVTNKFPFSLPWDIYEVISVLTVDPVRPELKVDINQEVAGVNVPLKMSHDFKWMDDIAPFIRTFILIGFTLFLIMKTRTLMGGAQ